MYGMDYSKLAVGDQVAVARMGSWDVHSEGVYTVVKADKIKVIVQREGDGYERTFSVKKRSEMGKDDRYRAAYLEPVADKAARDALQQRRRDVNRAWSAAEQAARDKKVSALRAALADLELLVD